MRDLQTKKEIHPAQEAIAATLILAVFSVAPLILTWDFHWYGNPDQDLVFLRDGIRLSSGHRPIYAEHPGALQAMSVGLVRFITSSTKLSAPIGVIPREADYQTVFQYTKALNLFAYAGILGFTYRLIRTLTRTSAAITWSLLTALSAGYIVETVQLRNEAFSALLFYLAAALAAMRYSEPKENRNARNDIMIGIIYISAATLSVFAKVQSIILFTLLDAGLILWLSSCKEKARGAVETNIWKWTCLALSLGMILSATLSLALNLSKDSIELVVRAASIAVLLFPVIGSKQRGPRLELSALSISLITFIILIAGFSLINTEWFTTAFNPLASKVHAHSAKNCYGTWCLAQNAKAGILLLFKRAAFTNIGASAIGAACLSYFWTKLFVQYHNRILKPTLATSSIVLSLAIFDAGFGISGKAIIAIGSILGFTANLCIQRYFKAKNYNDVLAQLLFWSSITMALICSLRWPVDHYLLYQQPLLFGALVIELLRVPSRYFIVCAVASLLLLTRVKLDILENLGATYQQQLDRSSKHFCAPQHQGKEWSRTFISQLECN